MNTFRLAARDLRRVVSVPAPWLLAACGVLMSAATTASLVALHSRPSGPAALAALPALAGLLGAVTVGADFRYGTLPAEILLIGGRLAYGLRTGLAVVQTSAALGVLLSSITLTCSQVLNQPAFNGLQAAAFVVVSAAVGGCWGSIGASLATLSRGAVAAIVGILGYLLVLEPMLETAFHAIAILLPGRTTAGLLSVPATGPLAADALRLLVLVLVLASFAAMTLRRRDIGATAN